MNPRRLILDHDNITISFSILVVLVFITTTTATIMFPLMTILNHAGAESTSTSIQSSYPISVFPATTTRTRITNNDSNKKDKKKGKNDKKQTKNKKKSIIRLDDDHSWVLTSKDHHHHHHHHHGGGGVTHSTTIHPVSIPGDIIIDLYHANIIPQPLFDNHFLTFSHVWMGQHEHKDHEDERIETAGGNWNDNITTPKPKRTTTMNTIYNNSSTTRRIDNDVNYYYDRPHDHSPHHHSPHHHSHHDQKRTTRRRQRMKQNYFIPRLKARTKTWIYARNFRLFANNTSHHNNNNLHTTTTTTTTTSTTAGAATSLPNHNNTHHHHQQEQQQQHKQQYQEEKDNVKAFLVIEGIKMGASIHINGIHIGNVTNQFKRYIYPISSEVWKTRPKHHRHQQQHQHHQQHTISISFSPDIDTKGRFMACSGGWDWAPYTQTAEHSCLSRRVFTFGIIRPLYFVLVEDVVVMPSQLSQKLVASSTSLDIKRNADDSDDNHDDTYITPPVIIHVVPKVNYIGKFHDHVYEDIIHDGERKDNHHHYHQEVNGNFQLVVEVYLMYHHQQQKQESQQHRYNSNQYLGQLIFRAPFFDHDQIVQLSNETITFLNDDTVRITLSTIIERSKVQLWWPRGSISSSSSSSDDDGSDSSSHCGECKPTLYSIQVAYRSNHYDEQISTNWIEKRIGE